MTIKSITYELGLKYRKGHCPIKAAGISEINFKDVELLRQFISEKGKIVPKRISGVSAGQQKKIAHAIKRSRNLALLSFHEETMVAKQAGSIYSQATISDITHDDIDLDIDIDVVDDDIVEEATNDDVLEEE